MLFEHYSYLNSFCLVKQSDLPMSPFELFRVGCIFKPVMAVK